MKKELRVWIELPFPSDNETAAENVKAINKMMRKLGAEEDVFDWMEDKKSYIRYLPEGAGFVYLKDNGDWFNLKRIAY